MSQSKDVVVRLQALDGVWEVGGVDRKRGIVPQHVVYSHNAWGPDIASFDMRRDPKVPWPDLSAGTPAEIDVGGVTVWDGRVRETPSRDGVDRVMSVQCEGWQYHLDDNLYERLYINNRLADWKDVRSSLSAPLGSGGGQYAAGWQVNSGDGVIVVTKPNGFNPGSFTRAGILLDGGSPGAIARLTGTYDTSGNWTGTSTLYAASGETAADALSAGATTLAAVALGGGQFRFSPTSARYVLLFVDSNGTPAADEWIRFTKLLAWGSTSWESSFTTSLLTGDLVIADALDLGTLQLSADRSGIDAPAFAIPALAPDGPRTTREVWEAANAYYDNISKVAVGRRPVFKAKPVAPALEVGAWSPMEPEDSSQNSNAETYNRVLVTGQTETGDRITVERVAAQQAGALTERIAAPAWTNPSADVNAAGWSSLNGGTITRDTATFDTAPASIRNAPPVSGMVHTQATFTGGTFRAGRTYIAKFRIRLLSDPAPWVFGDAASGDVARGYFPATVSSTGFADLQAMWTPRKDRAASGVTLTIGPKYGGGGSAYYDTCWLEVSAATLLDRRATVRAKEVQVRAPMPADGIALAQIGDVWLTGHRLTPFKGNVKLSGDQAVRNILSGHDFPLQQLGQRTGELLRFNDRGDPDTGGDGRDGRIATVSYDVDKSEAVVAIDNTRTAFEALLARLAVVTGAGQ